MSEIACFNDPGATGMHFAGFNLVDGSAATPDAVSHV